MEGPERPQSAERLWRGGGGGGGGSSGGGSSGGGSAQAPAIARRAGGSWASPAGPGGLASPGGRAERGRADEAALPGTTGLARGGGVGPRGPSPGDDDHVDPNVLRRFELVQKLGHSAWGVTWRAVDKRTRVPVALKKLYGAFDSRNRAQMAYREIALLEALQRQEPPCEHVVELRNVLMASDGQSEAGGAKMRAAAGVDADVYLVTTLCDADLFCAIRAGVVEPKHHPFIVAQLLRALAHIHALGIVHRDVKPSNLLISKGCHVRLCDFGHARLAGGQEQPQSRHNAAGSAGTDYLGSRWYRAPEALLGAATVDASLDMWGAGCVLGELLRGTPVFAGDDTAHQLRLILELTGAPAPQELLALKAPSAREQLAAVLATATPQPMSSFFPDATAEALDLARMLLQFNPALRAKAARSLRHPFVVEYYHAHFDPRNLFLSKLEPLELDDNVLHTVQEYRHLVTRGVDDRIQSVRSAVGQKASRFGYALTK
jgi:mitogen-activated protein kinase 15